MNTLENVRTVLGKTFRKRWFAAVVASISLGGAAAYFLLNRSKATPRYENAVDDHGMGQNKASKLLRNLRDRAFNADAGKMALALGRPEDEVRSWDTGLEVIDDDVIMKARGIALHRGINIE